jgi:hypothetical protein
MDQAQQWLADWWAFAVIGGPIILGLALAYGIHASRRRRRRRIEALSAGMPDNRSSTARLGRSGG